MKQQISEHDPLRIRVETAMTLLSSLYRINITCLYAEEQIEAFCSLYRLHKVQRYFQKDYLASACEEMKQTRIYHINDPFMIHFLLFTAAGIPFILGPFSPSLLNRKAAEDIFAQQKIQNLEADKLIAYHDSFPYINEKQALDICFSFIHTINPEEPQKEVMQLQAEARSEEPLQDTQVVTSNPRMLEKRYIHEEQFKHSIRSGNARSALYHLRMMEQDTTFYKTKGNRLENERIGAVIDHTVVRMSAIEAGLPVVVIDRITIDNIALITKAKTVDELLQAKEELIRSICRAVLEMKTQKYSAVVQSALYYLDHHYTDRIALPALSEELDISENYLIKKFKAETGVTPTTYLNQLRVKQAETLLLNGSATIGEISFAVGIEDANYFVKLFKKYNGQTPSEYRRSHTV